MTVSRFCNNDKRHPRLCRHPPLLTDSWMSWEYRYCHWSDPLLPEKHVVAWTLVSSPDRECIDIPKMPSCYILGLLARRGFVRRWPGARRPRACHRDGLAVGGWRWSGRADAARRGEASVARGSRSRPRTNGGGENLTSVCIRVDILV